MATTTSRSSHPHEPRGRKDDLSGEVEVQVETEPLHEVPGLERHGDERDDVRDAETDCPTRAPQGQGLLHEAAHGEPGYAR